MFTLLSRRCAAKWILLLTKCQISISGIFYIVRCSNAVFLAEVRLPPFTEGDQTHLIFGQNDQDRVSGNELTLQPSPSIVGQRWNDLLKCHRRSGRSDQAVLRCKVGPSIGMLHLND